MSLLVRAAALLTGLALVAACTSVPSKAPAATDSAPGVVASVAATPNSSDFRPNAAVKVVCTDKGGEVYGYALSGASWKQFIEVTNLRQDGGTCFADALLKNAKARYAYSEGVVHPGKTGPLPLDASQERPAIILVEDARYPLGTALEKKPNGSYQLPAVLLP